MANHSPSLRRMDGLFGVQDATLVIGADVGNVGEEQPKVQCNPKSNRLARLVCGSARVRCY